MQTKNRQINTGFNKDSGMISLKVLKDFTLGSKNLKTNEVLEVTKSQARRLLSTEKNVFTILLD